MVVARRAWVPVALILFGCSGCYDWGQFRFRQDAQAETDDAGRDAGLDAPSFDAPGVDAPSFDANQDAFQPGLCARNPGALHCDDYEGPTRPMGTTMIGSGCVVTMSGGRRSMQCETSGVEAALRITPVLPTSGEFYVRFSAQVLEGNEYFRFFRLGSLGTASLGIFPDGTEEIALEATGQPALRAAVSLRELNCYVLRIVVSSTEGQMTLTRENVEVATSPMTWRVGAASSIYLGIVEHDGLGRTRVIFDDVLVRRVPLTCD